MNRYQSGYRQIDPLVQEALDRLNQGGAPYQPQVDPDDEPAFDLRSLLGLVRRQKWTILAVILVGLGLGALYVSQVERQYTASSALVVDASQSEAMGLQPGLNDTLGTNSVVSTEIELVRSQRVLTLAAGYLDLPNSPVFTEQPSRLDSLLGMVGLGGGDDEEAPRERIIWASLTPLQKIGWSERLGSHLRVTQGGGATFNIAATTNFPEESAAWANQVAQAYLDDQLIRKQDSRSDAVAIWSDRVETARVALNDARSAFQVFLQEAIDQAGSPEARATLQNLRDTTTTLDAQQSNLATLQTALTEGNLQVLAREVEPDNPGVVAERIDLQNALAAETEAARIAAIQQQLADLENEILANAEARQAALQAQIVTQEQRLAETDATLRSVALEGLPSDLVTQLYDLQQGVTRAEQGLIEAQDGLRAAQQQSGASVLDAQIIKTATPPSAPSYPSVRSTMIMALLLSAAAGFGLALMRENLFGGVSSIEDMERDFAIPALAAVPKYKSSKGASPDWAIVDEPLSAFAESIRRARIGVESVSGGQQLRLVVTSSVPGEGKTTLALSIARALAKSGKSTVLIDADLRHPNVHEHIEQAPEAGLLNFLLRGGDGSHLIVTREASTGLVLIPGSDPSPVATDALIMSARFAKVVEYATEKFECVIFDSPPVGLVVDAQIIAREFATAALFVTKAESTGRNAVHAALRNLQMNAEIPVLGVLNQVSGGRRYYGKYSGYYR